MHYDSKSWKGSAGTSVPEWWAPVMAREQAEREAELRTEKGREMARARNEAVFAVMRAREGR